MEWDCTGQAGSVSGVGFDHSQTPHTTAVLQHTSPPNDSRQENQSVVLSVTDTTYYSCFTTHLATQ